MSGLIDTHAHLDGYVQQGSLPAVLERARAAGLAGVIAIGTEPADWEIHRKIAAERPDFVAYTVGLHPCSVAEGWERAVAGMEAFWQGPAPRPAALGEAGLDRFHLPPAPAEAEAALARQRAAFAAQLELARRLQCPVVIHSRQAFAECVAMIDESGVDWRRVVFHCFSEGAAEVEELRRRGGLASFTGILTYKNAAAVRAAAQAQGLAACMIETDAPYLAPAPHRGKPNEPALLKHTAEFAAELYGVDLGRLAEVTTANARKFYGIGF
jgi:TatD DNase family protein